MGQTLNFLESRIVWLWKAGKIDHIDAKSLCDRLCQLPISNEKAAMLDDLAMLVRMSHWRSIEDCFHG